MLYALLDQLPDSRRGQGKMYENGTVLFCSILAIMSGATSYRKIYTFMKTHFSNLSKFLKLPWIKPPSYSTIRRIICATDSKELETAFRLHAKKLASLEKDSEKKYGHISIDGKVVRGSFDHFEDQSAIQVLSAFLSKKNLILGHEEIENYKTNEIPMAQKLIKALKLKGILFTSDALHCQKKL